MLARALRHLLPGTCLMCDMALAPSPGPDLCGHCLDVLPWNEPACPRCAEPVAAPRSGGGDADLAGDAGETALDGCAACRRRPPPFSRALAPLRYETFPRLWVGRMKDHLGMVEGRILGLLLADAAWNLYRGANAPRVPDLLVPVPLTIGRLARRGHNQALTLAKPVAARLGIPLLRHAVMRRPRPRQRGLGRAARLGNLSGGFVSRRDWQASEPCIGIVDDVLTTGATVAELARVLLAAGAGEVHVLCATRTPRQKAGAASGGIVSA